VRRGRAISIDFGDRRVGIAVSDPTRTIARPLKVLEVRGPAHAATEVAKELEQLADDPDPPRTVVVGWPRRLDGTETEQTVRVRSFVDALSARTALPIVLVDERLSSREAESRLALREPNWRRRKKRLDAAAAAVILQDYLDQEQPKREA
jgi:putative Holliday junction resolvase